MTREEFDQTVARLEQEAVRHPKRYRTMVVALGLLGYLYIWGVLAVLLLLVVGLGLMAIVAKGALLVLKKLVVVLLGLIALVVRSLWVRVEAPTGRALTAPEAPKLFDVISRVRGVVQGPKIHQVLLTQDMNAAICQIPRWGLFGGHRNYLLLGIPLLQALSPRQFDAVLAHEYGHLAGAHGKSGAWVYRVRQTWFRLMEALESRGHWGSGMFTRFFHWYAPFFAAYSFVMARTKEYEADRAAAQFVSADDVASALTTVETRASFLDRRFWPNVFSEADRNPAPPTPYTAMCHALRTPAPRDEAEGWLREALGRPTGTDDTHPSLSDRLAALGATATVSGPLLTTAADEYVGPVLDVVLREYDAAWQQGIDQSWRERFEYVQTSTQRLEDLNRRAREGILAPQDGWDRARFTEEFRGATAAVPLYRELEDGSPDDPRPLFALGRLALAEGDRAGIARLETAMERDGAYILPACQLIIPFLLAQGERERANEYYVRAAERQRIEAAAKAERASLTLDDTFTPHDVPPERLKPLIDYLRADGRIKRAYLVQKAVRHLPGEPVFVLCVERHWGIRRPAQREYEAALAAQAPLPGESFVVVLSRKNRNFANLRRALPAAKIFERGDLKDA